MHVVVFAACVFCAVVVTLIAWLHEARVDASGDVFCLLCMRQL
jgi:hypothetical protein